MRRFIQPKYLLPLGVIIILLLSQVDDITIHNILILTLLYIGLSSAWNLLSGYTGSLSLGHAAFFGVGAYTSTILLIEFQVTPWIGMFVGAIMCVILALIIGLPSFRLKGPFFTLSSIAIAEILRIVAINWREVTNGSMGLRISFSEGPSNMVFSNSQTYIYLMLAYAFIVFITVYFIDKSKMGLYLKAVREEEDAATSIGINANRYKMISFIISALLTGIGGSLFVQFTLFAEPSSVFDINLSILIALAAILGGIGTLYGPVVGAIIIIPLSEILKSSLGASGFPGLHLVIYGVVLIVVIRWMPKGLYPTISSLIKNRNKKSQKTKIIKEV